MADHPPRGSRTVVPVARFDQLRCYRHALDQGFTGPMTHDQYNMVVDREWVEERLTTPFTRK